MGGAVSLQSESGERGELKQDGDGTYLIYTAENLKEFAAIVNGTDDNSADPGAHAKLMNDIDLSSVCGPELNDGTSWEPIGTSYANAYTGTFNGNGHTISGLYINRSADYQGLFGYVSGSGKIEKLTVSGTVSGINFVGGVVGYNGGNVINCTFSGSVSGVGPVGGVVGSNSFSATVTNCYNTGSVTGSAGLVGGVVGYNSGSVTNSYNTGAVSGGEDVGGVVGYNDGGSVENCYNTGEVSGNRSVGGVVGTNEAGTSVENCYNTGKVSGIRYVGGVVGYNNSGTVTGCYFLQENDVPANGIGGGETTGATAVDDLTALCDALKGDTWTISPFYEHPVLKANPEGGDGSEQHPYEIKTAEQLETFRDIVNGANNQTADTDAHAVLMNDIDLKDVCGAELDGGTSWTPIGTSYNNAYSGTFDGNGKTISGLYIDTNVTTTSYQGLFGYLSTDGDNTGTVQNLTVEGSLTANIANNSDVYVGGIVAYNNGGSVTNCTSSVAITATTDDDFYGSINLGGVVGYNYSDGSVTGCTNKATVSGGNTTSPTNVGGVVGNNFNSTVTNCYNTGTVSDGVSSGGVVGLNGSGSVTNCYNTGNVSGSISGGVVGSVGSGSVSNCYNTGSITGRTSGGVVGFNDSGSVTNCYNTGTVSDGNINNSDVGGVVGENRNGASVTNCYFLQTADVNVGRLGIGENDGTFDKVEAKDATAFHSGEVAHLLQSEQTDESGLVWGQSDLNKENSWPTLNPTDEQKVYQVTFDYGDSFTETDDQYDYRYANANDNVTLPTSTDPIPSYEGHTLTGWQDESGQTVQGESVTITSDTTYYAQWTKDTVNYTVTVTTSPAEGGTVNGGGTFAEGTQVTVTATANDGYTFVAWQEGDTQASTSASYTFELTGNRNLTAIFEKEPDPTPDPTPTPTPDPEPTGPSTDGSSGWDDILDELENTAKGDQITIDMGDETKVPAEIFESLAGKDVEISFDLGDIQWSVNGADIPTDTDFTDLDLGVSLGTSGIPVNVINTITGEVGTVQITLAHDGEFGFTMTLTAPLGKENAGYWANLYHYDEDAEALNFEAAAKIDETGSVTIPFSHASQYAIVIDDHSHAKVAVSDLFIDIAPNAWYTAAIQYAYDNGLMTGVSDTEFAPEATTTRAMIVSILARLENVTSAEAAGFSDVSDEWYATAVNWAASENIVAGFEDSTFRPNQPITREQLAAILMNYAACIGQDVSNRADLANYTDQPSTWAEEAMQWAVAEGLITGVTNTELQPQASATRAQVAAILERFLAQ